MRTLVFLKLKKQSKLIRILMFICNTKVVQFLFNLVGWGKKWRNILPHRVPISSWLFTQQNQRAFQLNYGWIAAATILQTQRLTPIFSWDDVVSIVASLYFFSELQIFATSFFSSFVFYNQQTQTKRIGFIKSCETSQKSQKAFGRYGFNGRWNVSLKIVTISFRRILWSR